MMNAKTSQRSCFIFEFLSFTAYCKPDFKVGGAEPLEVVWHEFISLLDPES